MSRRPSLAPWRKSVLELYGPYCVVWQNCRGMLEAHHVVYRSRGGADVPENGIPVCKKHHDQIHAGTLKVDPGWLSPQALDWLKSNGYVDWDDDGETFGRHHRSFAPRS